jgi:hypothetical protein
LPRITAQPTEGSGVSPADDTAVVRAIADAITRYVVTHPGAADSIDGIHRWWLLPTLYEESARLVKIAVAQLVSDGTLRQVVMEDGRVIYSGARR